MRRLNVGCGLDIRPAAEGWVNMDVAKLDGVDVVHDILRFPWPFEAGSFDHVYMSHVLEHVPHRVDGHARDGFVLVMEEVHRILRPGGTFEILSPHPESEDRWVDPTHTRVVHPGNFDYFRDDSRLAHYSSARFRVVTSEVSRRSAVARRFLPVGKQRLGLLEHVGLRVPGMRRLVYRKPWELRVVLQKP